MIGDGWPDGTELADLSDKEQEAQGSGYKCLHPRVDRFQAVGIKLAATNKVEAPAWYIQNATAVCVETARCPVRNEGSFEKKLEGLGILRREEVRTEVPGDPMVIWPAALRAMGTQQIA